MKLIEGYDSNYRYILVAARRARQLQGGAPPVIETHSRKPCRIAQDEIKAGKVKWVIPETPKSAVEAAQDLVGDVGGRDQCGGDIRDRGDGDDAEWVVRTARPRAGDQVIHRFGFQRLLCGTNERTHALEHETVR